MRVGDTKFRNTFCSRSRRVRDSLYGISRASEISKRDLANDFTGVSLRSPRDLTPYVAADKALSPCPLAPHSPKQPVAIFCRPLPPPRSERLRSTLQYKLCRAPAPFPRNFLP